ncbi:zinc-binding dehydrogenase [Streptomyces sp. NPDC002143]
MSESLRRPTARSCASTGRAFHADRSCGLVKHGGRIASPTDAAGYGPGRTNVVHLPCAELLAHVARHLADGTITLAIQHTYPLTEAAEAMRALATRHTRGKIALRID